MQTMNSAQKEAEERERRIVKFKNIDNESFTHSYRGISITIGAGEEYTARFPEGDHLALHLARKILSREAKKKLNPMDDKLKLWTPEDIETLKGKILTPIGSVEKPSQLTPEEQRKKDLKTIENNFPTKKTESPKPPEVTKKDVIAELEKRGVKVDVKKTREELLKDLMDLEAKGK